MNVLTSSALKKRATAILEQTKPDYRRLVALHAAVSFGVLLAIFLIQVLLDLSMTNDAGLSGMGASAIFTTAKSTLGTVSSLLLPFWEIGILYTSIRVTRKQETEFNHLTQGLRRWGPVLRYYLLLIVLFMGVAMLLSNLIPVFMMLFPIPQSLKTAMAEIDITTVTDPMALLEIQGMMTYILPICGIFMLIYFAVLIYLAYRFRMSQYLLVDEPGVNALPSLLVSNQMTKGYKWQLCKLDLSFWWYYLLQFALSALSFGPEILALAGVTLPISETVESLLFQVLYCVANVALVWYFGAYVQTTYACAYNELRNPPQDNTVITV